MAALVLLLGLVALATGSELTPFIAWSTEESFSKLNSQSSLDDITQAVKELSVPTVVVFLFDEISFDDITKYGGAFDSNRHVTELESAMSSASFQYWTGLEQMPSNWISELGDELGMRPTYVDRQDINKVVPANGFFVFMLSSSEGFESNDEVVGEVMKKVASNSYTALYTEGKKQENVLKRSTRSVSSNLEETPDSDDTVDDCPIGGKLVEGNDSTACIFFCLSNSKPLIFVPDSSNGSNGSCSLSLPYQLTYNCSSDNKTMDLVTELYGQFYPSVTLNYIVRNDSNATKNNCTAQFWEDFELNNPQLDEPRFADAVKELDVFFTFFFPKNVSYNGTLIDSNWAVMISSAYETRWAVTDDKPLGRKDDEDDKGVYVGTPSLLVRQNLTGLYQRFSVPEELSYACSAPQFSSYVSTDYDVVNSTLVIRNFNASDASGKTVLNLTSIQVQPYNISSMSTGFSATDNCVGYFTEATWMGIISMAVLIIIFYLAILCAFSIKTLDQFEDPRSETISVEKLH